MENNKLGQNEPAFPLESYWVADKENNGMSKRFYAACAAMQGMLANSRYSDTELNYSIPNVIELCYNVADELLEQENL